MKQELFFDVIILGSGPAGFSAAIYAARGNVKTAILDISMFGGQPSNYLELENYPGFSLVGGYDLMEKFEEHVDKFGVEKFPMEEIQAIELEGEIKTIETIERIFKAKAVIIATGAQPKKLGVAGEKEFLSRGVSYCAVCDGAFYKDKVVTVVGGGNAAVEEAMYLTKFASKVYLIHRRDELRADKIVQERAFKTDKLEFVYDTVVSEIHGTDLVNEIIVKNVKTNKISSIKADGIFPYIGFTPNSDMFLSMLETNQAGFIKTDENMRTSQKGVWAIGDIRTTPLRQVITAAADGAVAACDAVKFLQENQIPAEKLARK